MLYCFEGPTNGDFDSSIRKFSKVHTLGSFGKSFEGNGDHESVMNKVYNRLQNNGAGHYNTEQSSNGVTYDENNSNNNKNHYNSNRHNSNDAPSRKYPQSRRNYNRQDRRQHNHGSSQDNLNKYASPGNSDYNYSGSTGKDSFPNFGSSTHNKNLNPDDLFDFSNAQISFKKSLDSPESKYNQGSQSPRRGLRRRNSDYLLRPNPRYFHGGPKSDYYLNNRQYRAPQYLSSQHKGMYHGLLKCRNFLEIRQCNKNEYCNFRRKRLREWTKST